jgi:nitrite reductase/ring-hydroxylating ferredoxin subunit
VSAEFIRLASLDQIPLGGTLCVRHGGRELLLCHTSRGVVYAVDNLCTHAAQRLSEGRLKGCKLFCPLHGAAFDVRDGSALSRPAREALGTYPVRVQGDAVYIAPGAGAGV